MTEPYSNNSSELEKSTHYYAAVENMCASYAEQLPTNSDRADFAQLPLFEQTDKACFVLAMTGQTLQAVNLRAFYLVHSLEKHIMQRTAHWDRWLAVHDPFWRDVDNAFTVRLSQLAQEVYGVSTEPEPDNITQPRHEYQVCRLGEYAVSKHLIHSPDKSLTSVVYTASLTEV